MKKLRLLWAYSSGVRLAALVLLVVSCYALYSAVEVARSLKYSYDNYAFIRDTDLHGAYSFVPWNHPRNDEEWEAYDKFYAEDGPVKLLSTMEAHPAVEALGRRSGYQEPLYSIDEYKEEDPYAIPDPYEEMENLTHFSHYESAVHIMTLNPGMFQFFPNLKELLPFEDPHGVYIIGDEIFPEIHTGDTLHCYKPMVTGWGDSPSEVVTSPRFTVDFPVEGRYALPFGMPQMAPGGSAASESSIVEWQETPFLLMLDTEENREWLASVGFQPASQGLDFYIRYREDATKEEIGEVEAMFTPFGGLTALEKVQESLVENLKTTFLEQLPGAALRMAIMLLCYVSLIILTVRKKQKEIAVSYICGATTGKNANLITALLFLVTVPAGIFSLVYIYLAPSYAWQMRMGLESEFAPSFMHFIREIVPVSMVLVYFVLMLLLGWILVKASMARRSPIDYFKEANK